MHKNIHWIKVSQSISLYSESEITDKNVTGVQWVGAYGFRSLPMLTRLLRVLRHIMLTHPIASAAFLAAERVLRETVFPSSLLVQGNLSLTLAVWGCLGLLPFEGRFAVYNYAKHLQALSDKAVPKDGKPNFKAIPLLKMQWALVDNDLGRIFRRLTLPSDLEERRVVRSASFFKIK